MFSLSLQCAKLGATTRVSFSNTELSSHHNGFNITKTRPCNTSVIIHGCENENIQLKMFDYFHIFAQNIYFRVDVRTLTSIINICFRAKIMYTSVNPSYTI